MTLKVVREMIKFQMFFSRASAETLQLKANKKASVLLAFWNMDGAITRNQKRKFLRKCVSKARIGCRMGLLGKPFSQAYYRLLDGNA